MSKLNLRAKTDKSGTHENRANNLSQSEQLKTAG